MREFTHGSTAMVRGALDAGCTFFAGYPITPASPILMLMMRELPKRGGVAIQGEDEIASIGMCIGAALAGARAMTATSGPGISLYSENIGLAIMGEMPLVIVDVQRMGPATGGATTTGQGDIQFARRGTAGGYPIIALAPSSISECYHLAVRAFALAERFRCPVFLLSDKELNMTLNTVDVAGYAEGTSRETLESDRGAAPDLSGDGLKKAGRYLGAMDEHDRVFALPAYADVTTRASVSVIDPSQAAVRLSKGKVALALAAAVIVEAGIFPCDALEEAVRQGGGDGLEARLHAVAAGRVLGGAPERLT
jgi:pyruvate/2-oxoacid:ferredoxin oxidoreductase alpha subunit